MDFEIEGMDELIQSLEQFSSDAPKLKERALKESRKFFKNKVKENVVVRTGNLQKHIELSDVDGNTIFVYVDQQGPAYYGVMIEEGTSKMRAQPYMYPTFHRSRRQIERILANSLREDMGLMP